MTDETATLMVISTPVGPDKFFLDHGGHPDPTGKMPPPWTPERIAQIISGQDPHKVVPLVDENDWA